MNNKYLIPVLIVGLGLTAHSGFGMKFSFSDLFLAIARGSSARESLETALKKGDLKQAEYLINNGAPLDIDILILAVRLGDKNAVQLLLEKGVEVSKNDYSLGQSSPLHEAVLKGNKDIAELLLAYGAPIDDTAGIGVTALCQAVCSGNKALVLFLLSKQADPNLPNSTTEETSLHSAVQHNQRALVEILLQNGAQSNIQDAAGNTVLHKAVAIGNSMLVEVLLYYNADINIVNFDDKTPGNLALNKSYMSIAELITSYRELMQQAKNPTRQLFETMLRRGYYTLVTVLLKKGIQVEASDLLLAKANYEKAYDKEPYRIIGQLLLQYLRLVDGSGSPTFGPISRQGIIGAYGINKDIACAIAQQVLQ